MVLKKKRLECLLVSVLLFSHIERFSSFPYVEFFRIYIQAEFMRNDLNCPTLLPLGWLLINYQIPHIYGQCIGITVCKE